MNFPLARPEGLWHRVYGWLSGRAWVCVRTPDEKVLQLVLDPEDLTE